MTILRDRDGTCPRTYEVDFMGYPFSPQYWQNYLYPTWREIVQKCIQHDAILIIANFVPVDGDSGLR